MFRRREEEPAGTQREPAWIRCKSMKMDGKEAFRRPAALRLGLLLAVVLFAASAWLVYRVVAGTGGSAVGAPMSAAGPEPPHETRRAEGVSAADAGDPSPEQRQERLISTMWWHREGVVDALELSSGQRRRMDAVLRPYLRQRAARGAPRLDNAEFLAALRAGDLEAARVIVERHGQRVAEVTVAEAGMMLDVLEQLRPEQHRRLAEAFPTILSARWLRRVGGQRHQAGPRRPAPAVPRGAPREASP